MSQDNKFDATSSGMPRISALDALRKQAEGKAKQEDPAVVRAKAIDALDKEMRAVSAYLPSCSCSTVSVSSIGCRRRYVGTPVLS